jgi:hypothetical protein
MKAFLHCENSFTINSIEMKNKILIIITACALLFLPNVSFGQAPNLGACSNFAVFTATGAFNNTGPSVVTGDIGAYVNTSYSGFPPGILINGSSHIGDVLADSAATDVAVAYGDLSAVTCGTVLGVTMGSGQILTPGVYCTGAASTLDGNLTLDGGGNPNALFIIKVGGAFATGSAASVTLTGGTTPCNVYWQIGGVFTLGDSSTFQGTVVVDGAIHLLQGSSLIGRALSTAGAVSMATNVVTIVLPPVASVITAGGPTAICGSDSVILSGNVGGTWSNGATTAAITARTGASYFVVNATACGSDTSNRILVTINPLPTASVITAGGPTTFCTGDSVILSGNVGGTWSNGATTATLTARTGGSYFVVNANTCGSDTSNRILVTVNTLPTASVITAGGPTTFCTGDSVKLSGNVGGTWSTGATTATITVRTSASYFATNTNGCGTDTSNRILVTVNTLPTASVITAGGATTFCAGDSVILSGNTGGTWSTGATTASITARTGGSYFVVNANSCASDTSNRISVTVNPLPTASIISAGGATTFCTGDSVRLSGNVGGTWSTGATTATLTVRTGASYFVTNTNGCGTDTSNRILVTVNTLPTASVITAGGATTFCAGDSVKLSGNVGGTWSNGATTATINARTGGSYFVVNANGCGSDTSNRILVTVNPLPVASVITAGGTTTFCTGDSVRLSGNVGGTWSTGATTASITVRIGASYFVTNTNGCGTDTSNRILVTVNPLPVASAITAGGATTFCAGDSVKLSGNVGGTWSNGATTATIIVRIGGSYFVVNANGCGSDTSNRISVTVNPLPVASVITAGGATSFCAGDSVKLSGNVGGTWSNGATTATITARTSGSYFVVNATGCGIDTSNRILVTVNPLPLAIAGRDTSTCGSNSVNLGTTSIGGHTYSWTPPTGLSPSATVSNPVATTSTTRTYTLTETITLTGCWNTNSVTITIDTPLTVSVISAAGDTIFCAGGSVDLFGNNGGVWNTGDTSSTITVDSSGSYYVNSDNACSNLRSNIIVVTVLTSPNITVEPTGQTVCEGSPASFSVVSTGAGLTYQWRQGDIYLVNGGNISGAQSSMLIIASVNIYDTISNYNVVVSGTCASPDTSVDVALMINTAPGIVLQPDNQLPNVGGLVTFSVVAIGTNLTYQWRRGNANLLDTGNISGATTSTLTIDAVNYSDTASDYNVIVSGTCLPNDTSINAILWLCCCPSGIASLSEGIAVRVYPNPFTTSISIRINDPLQIKNCELKISNALGEEVLNTVLTNQITTLETGDLPSGVYIYTVSGNNKTLQTGRVVSLR